MVASDLPGCDKTAPTMTIPSLRSAGVDRAVALSALCVLTALATGPVTAFLVATRFTPTVQGYYYTFGRLLSLQFLAEMGLGEAIVQFSSHEWSGLRMLGGGQIIGEEASLSRLRSLAQIALRWYSVSAGFGVWVVWLLGRHLFSQLP